MNTLAQDIAVRLQRMVIDEEQYQPNEKIPNERTLAQDLGVSRASIREAIKILVGNGVLTVRRGVGTFVANNPGMGRDPLGLSEIQDRFQLLLDWYQVRRMLEPPEMELICDRITEEELKELSEVEQKCRRIASSGGDYVEADAAFHIELARLSGNPILARLVEGVTESVEFGNALGGMKARNNTIENHPRIVEYIRNHDHIGAYHAMRMHLLLGEKEAKEQITRAVEQQQK